MIAVVGLELGSVINDSQTIDEAVHIATGFSYLDSGDFRLNVEHPPLIKELAALPLLFLGLHFPYTHPGFINDDQWAVAPAFLYENTADADTILLVSRATVLLLSVLLALLVFKWSSKLFGLSAAFFSFVLFVFDPNILAHSRYVTTDVPMALGYLATIMSFYYAMMRPSWKRLLLTSVLLALSLVTKFSAVLLVPLLMLLWVIRAWQRDKKLRDFSLELRSFALFWLMCFGVFFAITWTLYGFETQKPAEEYSTAGLIQERLAEFENGTITEHNATIQRVSDLALNPSRISGQAVLWIAENIPIPFYSYYHGLGRLVQHNYWGHWTYLHGEYGNTFPHYFFVAFLVKTPEVTLIFLVLLVAALFKRFSVTIHNFEHDHLLRQQSLLQRFMVTLKLIPYHYIVLALPPILYFAWSLTSHINLGVRHLLPMYPFLYILIGALPGIPVPFHLRRAYRAILYTMAGMAVASSLLIYPHYLSYFNGFIGGPSNGYKYLLDSNLDWGQDLKRLSQYLEKNKISDSDVDLNYFGSARPSYYGIEKFGQVPTTESLDLATYDRVAVINIMSLISPDGAYSWLYKKTPTDRIGYSLYIYDFRN